MCVCAPSDPHTSYRELINRSTYLRIIKFVHDCISVPDTATARQNYLRIVGDICRIRAVEDNMSWKFAAQVINWKIDAYNQIGLYYREKETRGSKK